MTHYKNKYAKLSVLTGIETGISINDKVSLGLNMGLIIPIVSQYNNNETFQHLKINIPNFIRISLNGTFNL